MLNFVALLLVCQLIGEVIQNASGLPLPGPVIGMVILFIGLMIRGEVPETLGSVTKNLLDNLALLFVPAGVGVLTHLALIEDEWLPITLALVLSTVITIAVTALLLSWLLRISGKAPSSQESKE
ncbi:CidA/LrgA family protein [Limibacillus halophilus]